MAVVMVFSIVDLIADNGLDWGVQDGSSDVIAQFAEREDAELFIAAKSNNLTYSRDTAPDGLPIYELGDPEAPYGLSAMCGGYVVVRPPDEPRHPSPDT